MKHSTASQPVKSVAFTLIELLVVIAIIGVLAAMILPVLGHVKDKANENKARTEITMIGQAIQSYYADNSRYPVSSPVMTAAANFKDDFTYGGTFTPPGGAAQFDVRDFASNTLRTNDDVIAILMDIPTYPGSGLPTCNTNHAKNPKQIKYLNAKMSGWDSTQGKAVAGVGNDLVYRDPWGNPYIISFDLNYDEKCRDSVYRRSAVSFQGTAGAGFNGLSSLDTSGASDTFEHNGGFMVWSLGIDQNMSSTAKAIAGVNKDNVLSWK